MENIDTNYVDKAQYDFYNNREVLFFRQLFELFSETINFIPV